MATTVLECLLVWILGLEANDVPTVSLLLDGLWDLSQCW